MLRVGISVQGTNHGKVCQYEAARDSVRVAAMGLERLLAIPLFLGARRRVRASDVAARFEVSLRTALAIDQLANAAQVGALDDPRVEGAAGASIVLLFSAAQRDPAAYDAMLHQHEAGDEPPAHTP
jgi:hypothetical protein